jgi:hypothetical protein
MVKPAPCHNVQLVSARRLDAAPSHLIGGMIRLIECGVLVRNYYVKNNKH